MCHTVLCTIRDVIECQISVQFYAHMKLNKTQESEEKTPSKVYVEKKSTSNSLKYHIKQFQKLYPLSQSTYFPFFSELFFTNICSCGSALR